MGARGFCLAALAAVLMAGSASAGEIENDQTCIAALSYAFDKLEGDESQGILSTAIFYYIGRLDVAAPQLDLSKALKAGAESLEEASVGDKAEKCLSYLGERGKALETAGKILQGN